MTAKRLDFLAAISSKILKGSALTIHCRFFAAMCEHLGIRQIYKGPHPYAAMLNDLIGIWDCSLIRSLEVGDDLAHLKKVQPIVFSARFSNITSLTLILVKLEPSISNFLSACATLTSLSLKFCSMKDGLTITLFNALARCLKLRSFCYWFSASNDMALVSKFLRTNLRLKNVEILLNCNLELEFFESINFMLRHNKFLAELRVDLGEGNTVSEPSFRSLFKNGLASNSTLELLTTYTVDEQSSVFINLRDWNAVRSSISLFEIDYSAAPNDVAVHQRDTIALQIFCSSRALLLLLIALPAELIELVFEQLIGLWFPLDGRLLSRILLDRGLIGHLQLQEYPRFSASNLIRVCEEMRLR